MVVWVIGRYCGAFLMAKEKIFALSILRRLGCDC